MSIEKTPVNRPLKLYAHYYAEHLLSHRIRRITKRNNEITQSV